MNSTQARPMNMALEVMVLPVADVERAKEFYASLGWRLDADIVVGDAFRLVQFTPPGSACSIHFGKGLTSSTPGSAGGTYLVVSDIAAAREELLGRGVEVSEVFHRSPGHEYLRGADPQRQSYASFVSFRDPDGNTWIVQEVTVRLPGRVAP
jgi:catechol 2,3-dioxygenase-like lactoylglutathione lyase family enzyme